MRKTLLSSPQIQFFRGEQLPAKGELTEEQLNRLKSLGYL